MLRGMKPADICKTYLGMETLENLLGEFSSPQIKATLKEGGVRVKLPGGFVSQQKRRKLWLSRIMTAVEQDNEELAAEFLQQWLLNHRRAMLISLLDRLEVKHQHGETDDSFLVSQSADRVRDAATWLMGEHEPRETAAYLHYIAYQQRSNVFDGWEGFKLEDSGAAPTAEPSPEPSPEPKPSPTT
jgi:hypothetical protein